jgi:hypothetical protein
MDLVLGMDFLGKHDVTVQARKSQISIAAEPNPIVVRANPNSPTDPEDTGAAIELLSAAQFARHCKVQGSRTKPSSGTSKSWLLPLNQCWSPDTEIESLVGRQQSRGRPRTDGRPHYRYRVHFQDRDSHYDMWLTERVLRQRYPTSA